MPLRKLDEHFIHIFSCPRYRDHVLRGFLHERGANVDAVEPATGLCPVLYSAMHGDIDSIEWLHKNGANMCARDRAGSTALHFASVCGAQSIVKFYMLRKLGLDIDCKNTTHATPLFWAVGKGDLSMCKLLHAYGANLNARTIGNWRPYDQLERAFQRSTMLSPQRRKFRQSKAAPRRMGANITGSLDDLKVVKAWLAEQGAGAKFDTYVPLADRRRGNGNDVANRGKSRRYTRSVRAVPNDMIPWKGHAKEKRVLIPAVKFVRPERKLTEKKLAGSSSNPTMITAEVHSFDVSNHAASGVPRDQRGRIRRF